MNHSEPVDAGSLIPQFNVWYQILYSGPAQKLRRYLGEVFRRLAEQQLTH
jgi:hypothetical protein